MAVHIHPNPTRRAYQDNGKHIDLANGYLIIPDPKEKRPKLVPMLDEDIALIKYGPRGFPELRLFPHVKGISGCAEGKPFGEKYFYKWFGTAYVSDLN